MLERARLLGALETVAPALADNDLVPLFTHFIFTGNRLMAYCERLAISAPLKTEFKGAVPGKIMLDMLRASAAKNVDMQASSNGLKIKAGKYTNITLPMMGIEGSFQMPSPAKPENTIAAEPTKFFKAIDDCLQSVKQYSTLPDMLGITLIPSSGRASLYSTDDNTLSHATFKIKKPVKNRIILSADFCREMLRLQANAEHIALEIRDDYAMFSAGSHLLYGKLLQTNNPLKYDQILDRVKVAHTDKSMCEKPKGMDGVLDRAILITDIAGREIPTKLTIDANKARFESDSERGRVVDNLEFTHSNISVGIKPKLWRKLYDRYEKFKVTGNAVVMTHSTGLCALSVTR